MLARLSRGTATVSELAAPLAMSLPAVSKHLGVLEDAGLVTRERSGRVRVCTIDPASLEPADAWIRDRLQFWNDSLDAFAALAEQQATDPQEEPE